MRSHVSINHTSSQVSKQYAMQEQLATCGSNSGSSTQNSIKRMTKVNVDHIESTHLPKSVKEREGECALEAECRRLAEELHRLQQLEARVAKEQTRELQRLRETEKARIADEQAKELHRLQEKEKVRIADEQVKELQRLRDLEKARLAEEEELKRLRVLDKTQKDRQQSEQPYRVRIAAEQAIERLPGKGGRPRR